MRKLRIIGVLAISAGTLAILPVTSASAAETDATFTLAAAGGLNLTAQDTAALGNSTTGDTSITGNLGVVNVTDARGVIAGWDASASSTAFTDGAGSSSTGISYTGGTVTETGSVTVADGAVTAMSGVAAEVVSTTAANGNNTASWNPTLDVTLPSSALAGDYAGTVTTSVL